MGRHSKISWSSISLTLRCTELTIAEVFGCFYTFCLELKQTPTQSKLVLSLPDILK